MSAETAAVHEAGHAVVAILLGFSFERVELGAVLTGLEPGHLRHGRLVGLHIPSISDPAWRHAAATVLYAGVVAEAHLAGVPDDKLEGGSDQRMLREMFPEHWEPRGPESAAVKAIRMVRGNAAAVFAVADRLHKARQLPGGEVLQVVQGFTVPGQRAGLHSPVPAPDAPV